MADRTETVYDACDRAIKAMNRESLKEFGRLKLANWDQLNVIREVTRVYERSRKRARQKYYEIAFEVYVLVLMWCEIDAKKAHSMAEKAITDEWVDQILEDADPLTLYSFDAEKDRKAQRLIEALGVTSQKDLEIDKALKLWSRQLGQYAINFTDYAAMQAFEDADIEAVEWVTQKDERVCNECGPLDGKVFLLSEVPLKPHWGCRCFWRPADPEDAE